MATAEEILSAFKHYYARHPNLDFPDGGNKALPLDEELAILDVIDPNSITAGDVKKISSELDQQEAYSLVILAVRTAILAVRRSRPELLSTAVVLLTIDDLVDYRDMLGALSAIEWCCSRLSEDIGVLIQKFADLACERRKQIFFEAYLSRSAKERQPDVMGFQVEEKEGSIRFISHWA